jgi:hypothetical protein
MKITFSGSISKQEYLKAIKFNYEKSLRGTKILFGIILFSLLTSIIILAIVQPAFFPQKFLYFFPAMLGLLAFFSFPFWLPLFFANSYERPENIYRYPVSGEIDEEEILLVSNSARSTFQWNFYTKYYFYKDMVLLFHGNNSLDIFSRSLFSTEEDWQSFIQLVKTKIKNK